MNPDSVGTCFIWLDLEQQLLQVIVIPAGSGVRIPYLGEDNFGDLGEVSDAAGEPREDCGPSRDHAVQDGHPEVREK